MEMSKQTEKQMETANERAHGIQWGKQLMNAILHGDNNTAIKLIQRGAAINEEYENKGMKCTPLGLCAVKDRVEIAKLLLINGADINKATVNSYYPLEIAIRTQSDQVAKLLIKEGAKAMQINGEPPLNYITSRTTLENVGEAKRTAALNIAKALIEKGDNLNRIGKLGTTPLMEAAATKNYELVETLLKHNADLYAKKQFYSITDAKLGSKEKWTALDYARGDAKIVALLKDTMKKNLTTKMDRNMTKPKGLLKENKHIENTKGAKTDRKEEAALLRQKMLVDTNNHDQKRGLTKDAMKIGR